MYNLVVIFKSGKVSKFTVKDVLTSVPKELKLLDKFKRENLLLVRTPLNDVICVDLDDVSMIQVEETEEE